MRYIESKADEYVKDLRKLCRQPSVSAQGVGIEECAELLREFMEEAGISARVYPVKEGNPVVLGEVRGGKEKNGCIGFYNHYDVQPPEPLELWETPPFEAAIRDGKIYARGVSDNKGNVMARIEAVKAVREVLGEVPIDLKFLVEGEEEVGSPHLPNFVKGHAHLLKADGYIWEGDGVDEKNRPVITLGAKGIIYVEFRARGAKRDAHSSLAPLIPNPAWRLVWALSTIKGPDEKIRIPGWYDDVVEPSDVERKLLEEAPFEEEERKRELGLKEFLGGLKGFEALKALYFSPTATICGLDAGYKGPGAKTVLPCEAVAKMDFRLVEAQKPRKLLKMLREHLDREGFSDIEVVSYSGYEPAKTSPSDPFARYFIETVEKVYGNKPVVLPTTAGTSPIYTIRNWMGIPVASGGGVGYPRSNVHAPNENIRIEDYIRSIKFVATLITSYKPERLRKTAEKG